MSTSIQKVDGMLIEHPDELKAWLTTTLSPICDADPAALAKYVLALLKKDKTGVDLREFCADQLDVFLQKETKGFVDKLFAVISDKSYMPVAIPVTKPDDRHDESDKRTQHSQQSRSKRERSSRTSKNDQQPAVSSEDQPTPSKQFRESKTTHHHDPPQVVTVTNGTTAVSVDAASQQTLASLDAQRSHSPIRAPLPRGGGNNDEKRHASQRSPTDRRRSRSRDRSRRNRDRGSGRSGRRRDLRDRLRDERRSRSPRGRRGSRARVADNYARSSLSPPRRRGRHDSGEENSRSRSPSARAKSASPSEGYSPKDYGSDGESELPSKTRVPVDTSVPPPSYSSRRSKKPRCRDYDEKGFCMRGDLCPFDHGADPVVVEDVALPGMIGAPPPSTTAYAPLSKAKVGDSPSDKYNPEAPELTTTAHPPVSTATGGVAIPQPPPHIIHPPPAFSHPPPPINWSVPPPGIPYLPYPVGASTGRRDMLTMPHGGYGLRSMNTSDDPSMNMHHGYGGRRVRPGTDGTTSEPVDSKTLLIRKIPPYLNKIAKLNRHFGIFGNVTNIQVQYQGDTDAALIQYESKDQAESAYRSNLPILNNRFIKVFRAADASQPKVEPKEDEEGNKRSVTVSASGNVTQTVYNPAALKTAADQIASGQPQPQQPVLVESEREKKAKMMKENLRKAMELQKKKMELFQNHLNQQKALLSQLDKCTNADQKREILRTIKLVEGNIGSLREDLKRPATKSKPKTKEELEKLILDAEMEVVNAQEAGEETAEIDQKLKGLRAQLVATEAGEKMKVKAAAQSEDAKKAAATAAADAQQNQEQQNPVATTEGQAAAVSAPAGAGRGLTVFRGRGRGGYRGYSPYGRGRGRGMSFSVTNLDKRPRDLTVSGFRAEDSDRLLEHLKQFGFIEKCEFDESREKAVVSYRTRTEAERAVRVGSRFLGATIKMLFRAAAGAAGGPEEDEGAAAAKRGADAKGAGQRHQRLDSGEMTAEQILAQLGDDEDEDDLSNNEDEEDVLGEDSDGEKEVAWKR